MIFHLANIMLMANFSAIRRDRRARARFNPIRQLAQHFRREPHLGALQLQRLRRAARVRPRNRQDRQFAVLSLSPYLGRAMAGPDADRLPEKRVDP